MDQYRDTPIRSRDSDAVAARRPIPVFHVKPWEHQEPGPVCFWTPHFRDTARVGTWDGCSSSRAEPMKASGKVSAFIELASAPVFTPRTRSDRWFHVKLKVAFQRSSLLASMTNRRYQRCRHQAACLIDPRGHGGRARRSQLGVGFTFPYLPQTPAQRRDAEGRGRCRPPPQLGPLHERWDALVRAHARFTKAQATPQPAFRMP